MGAALARWQRPLARHDPGTIVLDLAITLAIGGDSWPPLCPWRIGAITAAAPVLPPHNPHRRTVRSMAR